MALTLYTYFRSSAAYRVRIALQLKGIDAEYAFVDLRRDGGDQKKPEYVARNPQRLIPLLVEDDFVLNQSLAILEYLEERHPLPPLLPGDARGRAHVRALACMVCCDVHPLQNMRVQEYIKREFGRGEKAVLAWVQHWIDDGLTALETMLAGGPRAFCHGDSPTLADVCLIPQLNNARRYGCDLTRYPTLTRIEATCRALDAFERAAPERQPDASI
jgi:maleylpyruvate isomerase